MYTSHELYLSDGQRKKLMKAYNDKIPIHIKLSAKQLVRQGNTPILLTPTQLNRISNSIAAGVGMVLKLSAKQLSSNKKEGGFLPFLIPIITAALGGIAGAVATKGTNKVMEAIEEARAKRREKKGREAKQAIRQSQQFIKDVSQATGSGLMPLGQGLFPYGVKP